MWEGSEELGVGATFRPVWEGSVVICPEKIFEERWWGTLVDTQ